MYTYCLINQHNTYCPINHRNKANHVHLDTLYCLDYLYSICGHVHLVQLVVQTLLSTLLSLGSIQIVGFSSVIVIVKVICLNKMICLGGHYSYGLCLVGFSSLQQWFVHLVIQLVSGCYLYYNCFSFAKQNVIVYGWCQSSSCSYDDQCPISPNNQPTST